MQSITEIRVMLENVETDLVNKGWRQPLASLYITSTGGYLSVGANHPHSDDYEDRWSKSYYLNDENWQIRLWADLEALSTAEEEAKVIFNKSLSRTIEVGKKVGIDADLVRPLEEQMKKLSTNILEYTDD